MSDINSALPIPFDQFLVSAVISWIECNGQIPDLLIETSFPGVSLPPHLMSQPQVAIGAHASAIVKTNWNDNEFSFNCRFSGRDFRVKLPYHAIVAIRVRGTDVFRIMPWSIQKPPGVTDVGPADKVEAAVEEPAESVSSEPASGGNNVVQGAFGQPRKK